jgi:hypothetical protein
MFDAKTYANATNVWIASIPLDFANILLACVVTLSQELGYITNFLGGQEVVAIGE